MTKLFVIIRHDSVFICFKSNEKKKYCAAELTERSRLMRGSKHSPHMEYILELRTEIIFDGRLRRASPVIAIAYQGPDPVRDKAVSRKGAVNARWYHENYPVLLCKGGFYFLKRSAQKILF